MRLTACPVETIPRPHFSAGRDPKPPDRSETNVSKRFGRSFDEPLSNLDAKLRVQMRTEIGALHARPGATMVYVTHDQVEAMTLGSRIAVMLDGTIQQVARPLEQFNEPTNMFVAGFIGSPQMNFISGAIRRHGGLRFVGANGAVASDAPPTLDAYAGQDVVLGIRPECLRPATPRKGHFAAALRRVEPLGSELILYLVAGSNELICRLPADVPFGDDTLQRRRRLRSGLEARRQGQEDSGDLALQPSLRWQAERRPGAISFNVGRSSRQRGIAYGQRGWKWQPGGGSSGEGISPEIGW